MATRRTRLKGRKSPQSTERKQVKRGTATTQVRKKNAATPTGHAKIARRLRGRASPRQAAKVKPKSEQITPPKAKNTKAAVADTSRKTIPKDEYEFDETDDFISGISFLSTSFSSSGSNSKKAPKNVASSNVKTTSNKTNLVNQQKGKQKNARKQHARPEGNKKKTSTPLSEVANNAPKGQQKKSQGKHQQYLQVAVPKLDFDVSVTPILPISANQSPATRSSPRLKTRKGSGVKSVSFEDSLVESVPSQTPAGKITRKRTQRQTVVAPNTSSSSASGEFKESAPILPSVSESCTTVPGKVDRKRRRPETNSSTEANTEAASTPAKRQRTGLPKTKQSLLTTKKTTASPQKNLSSRNKSTKKQTSTKRTELSLGSLTQIREHLRQRKVVTSTPASVSGKDQEQGEGQKEEATQSSPPAYDSGISMGENLSVSEETSSGAPLMLPGFMEDEPVQSSMEFLDDLPLSAPSSSSSKEVPATFKSAAKVYKPSKTKREKGRYSTSRIDAWAEAFNQSLEDVESFELMVE